MSPGGSRLASRHRRMLVIVLGAVIALALSGIGIQSGCSLDAVTARGELEPGSVECGAAGRLVRQGNDLHLRAELQQP